MATSTGHRRYGLRRPCKHCPFRRDLPGYLPRDRAAEIAGALADGAEFPCHETTAHDPVIEENYDDPHASRFCAGALLVMEAQDAPNQAMRMAERFGWYDPSKMDRSAPVVGSLAEFVSHHGEDDEEEAESCSVVDMGCLAPAGHMRGGLAVPAAVEAGATSPCASCGEPVCESCIDGEVCPYCAEGEA